MNPFTSPLPAPQLFDLRDRVALVTGGSRGLGLQMAEALAEAGARVVLAARKPDELEQAAGTLRERGLNVGTAVLDLTDFERLPAWSAELLEREGRLDILVNNAGTAWAEPAETTSDTTWQRVMDLNLNGLFFLTREFARRSFIPRSAGKIINIASIGALAGNAPDMKTVAYNASKGAVVSLTRTLASEWGPMGLQVNAICPGFFRTRLSTKLLDRVEPAVLAKTPLRRLGGDEDLKGTVVYLASRASDYVTGQCIIVDGGGSTTLFADMLGHAPADAEVGSLAC